MSQPITIMPSNITEEVIEYMRSKLIEDGKGSGAFASTRNLVQYMEAEEVYDTFMKAYPDAKITVVGL